MSRTYDHGGNVFTVARHLGLPPTDICDFSASINPLGLSPAIREAIADAMESLIHYPDSSHQELKQVLAGHHGLAPENFALANGSTELIYNLPALFSGRRALVVSPSFSEYLHALNQHQCKISHFILSASTNFALDMNALQNAVSKGCDALYLCNPGNPSGTLYPPNVIKQVGEICRAAGAFLVVDEAFMDFYEDASAKQLIVQDSNSVILRSMTKFFGFPGLRLGYAIGSPSLIERLDVMGGPWSVNTLALAAGVAALHDAEHARETIAYVREERSRLFEQLAHFPQLKTYPSVTNFILVEIIVGPSAIELKERLMQQRILIRDCSNFEGLSSRFFRIAVRTAGENERLLVCLREVFNSG